MTLVQFAIGIISFLATFYLYTNMPTFDILQFSVVWLIASVTNSFLVALDLRGLKEDGED